MHHGQCGSYFKYLLYKAIGDDDDENNDDDGGIVEVDWLELHRIERRCGRWGMYGDTRTLEVLVVSCNTLQCNPISNHDCATNVLLYHNKLNWMVHYYALTTTNITPTSLWPPRLETHLFGNVLVDGWTEDLDVDSYQGPASSSCPRGYFRRR